MEATKKTATENRITVDTEDLQALLGCGRGAALEIGEKAQAKIKVGRRTLWNVARVKAYVDAACES